MNNGVTFQTIFTNQDAIEFAYIVKDHIELLIQNDHALGIKLCFEEANCYVACFYHAKELLSQVKPKSCVHETLRSFFLNDDRELDNSWDRLRWVKPEDGSELKMDECPF